MNIYIRDFLKFNKSISNMSDCIQKAIDYCNLNGGGKVIFDGNFIYKTGMIYFKDNVEIYIEAGSILMASDNLDDFDYTNNSKINILSEPTWDNCDYNGKPTKFFIYAYNCKNIAISGEGIIDGNEEIFYGKVSKYHIDGFFYPRVPLIYFENSSNIKITNVTLKRSAFWTTHLVGCNEIYIDNVRILNNLRLANCDGIDPDHCKNVSITNCYIEAADDCIVFKTTKENKKYGACENIIVKNCTLISTSAAIKFGTESVSDFKNIEITDCKILKSNRGIAFQLRDEGNISDIRFKNIYIETRRFSPIEWWGKAEPIVITAVKRKNDSKLGVIRNISFENITCDVENGLFIYGDSLNIKDLSFKNMNLILSSKTNWEKNIYDLRPSEGYGVLKMPLKVIYINNASNITFTNFNYEINKNIQHELEKEIEVINSDNIIIC